MILNEFESFLTTSNHIKSTQNKFPAIFNEFIPDHKKNRCHGINAQIFHSRDSPFPGIDIIWIGFG